MHVKGYGAYEGKGHVTFHAKTKEKATLCSINPREKEHVKAAIK